MWGRPFNYIKPVPKPGYRQVNVFDEVFRGNTESIKRAIDRKIMRNHMQMIGTLCCCADEVCHELEIRQLQYASVPIIIRIGLLS